MAAPHVAGTAGLMLSINPGLLPEQVTSLLRNTASALPNCGSNCGPGLLNTYAAVNNARYTTTGACSTVAASASKLCTIDSIGQYVNSSGTLVESVFAYGYLWQFDVNGNRLATTKKLRALPRYANGPCAFTPTGQECKIDSATILNYPSVGYVESVTAYGRYWNFDQNGNGWGGDGSFLSSVPRYANGPCAYAASYTTCTFDTRNMINPPEWGQVIESITAYGRYWIFDASGTVIGTDTLLSVPRFANGPCAYRPAGTTCTFGSRELRSLPGGGMIETITAYGRYFQWDANGTLTVNQSLPKTSRFS